MKNFLSMDVLSLSRAAIDDFVGALFSAILLVGSGLAFLWHKDVSFMMFGVAASTSTAALIFGFSFMKNRALDEEVIAEVKNFRFWCDEAAPLISAKMTLGDLLDMVSLQDKHFVTVIRQHRRAVHSTFWVN